MSTSERKPLIGADGEVREITEGDLKFAKRGRPALPDEAKKKRINITLDSDVVDAMKASGVKLSSHINALLRKEFHL